MRMKFVAVVTTAAGLALGGFAVGIATADIPDTHAAAGRAAEQLTSLSAATKTIVTTFAPGHGFTTNAGGSADLNDTSDYRLGRQSVSATTDGSGTAKTIKKTGMAPLDMTSKFPVVLVKIDDTAHVAAFQLWLGKNGLANACKWEMKNNQSAKYILAGKWVLVPLSFSSAVIGAGTPTRTGMTDAQFRLVDDARGAVTVHLQAIYLVPEPASGVLSFTFDDGWLSQYTDARPKLDQHLYPATAYVTPQHIGTTNYMTLAQLTNLRDYNGWQIAGHDVGNDLRAYTQAQLRARFQYTKTWLDSNGFDDRDYAYAGGEFGPLNSDPTVTVEDIAKLYFRSARSISQTQHETMPVGDVHKLRVLYVVNTTSTSAVRTAVTNAINNKDWLILVFHRIVNSPSVSTDYGIANFDTVVDSVATSGITVRTVADELQTLGF